MTSLNKAQKEALKKDMKSLQKYANSRKRPTYKTPLEQKKLLEAEAKAFPSLLDGQYCDDRMASAIEHVDSAMPKLSEMNNTNLDTLLTAVQNMINVNDESNSLSSIKLMLQLNHDTTLHDLVDIIHAHTDAIDNYYKMVDNLHEYCKEKKREARKNMVQSQKVHTQHYISHPDHRKVRKLAIPTFMINRKSEPRGHMRGHDSRSR